VARTGGEPDRFKIHDLKITASFLKMPDKLPELSDRSEARIQNGVYGYEGKDIKLAFDGEEVPPNSAGSFPRAATCSH